MAQESGIDERVQTDFNRDNWIAVGRGGWLFWYQRDGHDVRLRVDLDAGSRLVVTAVSVEVCQGRRADLPYQERTRAISSTDLRAVPLGKLEAMINSSELSRRIKYYLSARRGPNFEPGRLSAEEAFDHTKDWPMMAAMTGYRLAVAPGKSLTDEFFEGLAMVHSKALAYGEPRPVVAIAEENDVPIATVNRWLREARRRQIIPPARRSKAPVLPEGGVTRPSGEDLL